MNLREETKQIDSTSLLQGITDFVGDYNRIAQHKYDHMVVHTNTRIGCDVCSSVLAITTVFSAKAVDSTDCLPICEFGIIELLTTIIKANKFSFIECSTWSNMIMLMMIIIILTMPGVRVT